ncbi:MAG: hypothetical protein VSS75_007155, partial [Candidatus Parabeggiatoa sp.]|nr:hypothetical protein [Candidatus Parabeggiatoa sp.]
MRSYLKKRPPTKQRETNWGPPPRRRNNTLARAIAVALLAGSVVPTTSFAASITINGCKLADPGGPGDGLGGHTIIIQDMDTLEVHRPKTPANGCISYTIDDTTATSFKIATVNPIGWEQTAPTDATGPGMMPFIRDTTWLANNDFKIIIKDASTSNPPNNQGIQVIPITGNHNTFKFVPPSFNSSEFYTWDFGDGIGGIGGDDSTGEAFHTYLKAETYTVVLQIGFEQIEYAEVVIAESTYDHYCSKPQIVSTVGGGWTSTTNPFISPFVIGVLHPVDINAGNPLPSLLVGGTRWGVCIGDNGILRQDDPGDLQIEKAAFVYNRGKILGKDGVNGYSSGITPNHGATRGGNVSITANTFIVNEKTIKAGRGGHDITHNYVKYTNIHARGQDGGSIAIIGQTVVNAGGGIGPKEGISYDPSKKIPDSDGGNGGVASNTDHIYKDGCQSHENSISDDSAKLAGEGHNGGDATGGKGGALNIAGTLVQGYPTTTFSSGTGGDARIWCSETATPGTA